MSVVRGHRLRHAPTSNVAPPASARPPRIGGTGIVFCVSAVALMGPRSSTISRPVYVIPWYARDTKPTAISTIPIDDERKFHGASPFGCSLTLSGAGARSYWTLVQPGIVPAEHSTDCMEQELIVEWLAEVRGRSGYFSALAQ